MKQIVVTNLKIALLAALIIACGWKPEVTAVPLTAPWAALNLPVKENAVVWKSEPNEFRAVHKDDRKTVMTKYADALKAQGFALGKFDASETEDTADFTKGAEKYSLRLYDFDNTGVVIEKK